MQLKFYKIERNEWLPTEGKLSVYLKVDDWNDYNYQTLYEILLFDEYGVKHDLGYIKIANFGQTTEERIELPRNFTQLEEKYFSLGQGVEYYIKIQDFSFRLKEKLLIGLRDIVYNEELQKKVLNEEVTNTSLLRDTGLATIKGQYKRILRGDAILTAYNFRYETQQSNREAGYRLSFGIEPNSNPPSNIHVLIGRNGVGKTHLLNNMIKTLIKEDSKGIFISSEEAEFFSGVVSVSYSAFDPFPPYSEEDNTHENFWYTYIGLKEKENIEGEISLKKPDRLSEEFLESIRYSFRIGKKEKWINAVKSLESDPLFALINIRQLVEEEWNDEKILKRFRQLSSGHAIVLLTLTKLVETIEEKTLVLLDEPEGHLHPPLLSAFIRALSDLLINRNAVAIIATHSPVIVQEVPKNCVWKLSRFGLEAKAERPEIETFGENISTLTREIFGLEVTESGFHKLLKQEVEKGLSFEQILRKYNNQLGFEAQLLLRALAVNNNRFGEFR